MQLLEEYALDDDMDLDLFADPADGTKRTLTMSEVRGGSSILGAMLSGSEARRWKLSGLAADFTVRAACLQMEDETTDASASSLGSGGRASSTVSSVTTASSTKKRKTDAPRKKSEEQMERRR